MPTVDFLSVPALRLSCRVVSRPASAPARPVLPSLVIAVAAAWGMPAAVGQAAGTAAEAVETAGAAEKRGPEAARAEFEAAMEGWKEILAELTVLQAEYQKPGSDKRVIAASYDEFRAKAAVADKRLQQAAMAFTKADPEAPEPRKVIGANVAVLLGRDRPREALAMVELLENTGGCGPDVLLIGATAALICSKVDESEALVEKAIDRGMSEDEKRVTQLRAMIAASRPKIEAEMAARKRDAEAGDLPRVKLETTKGDIVVELFEDDAPNTVANFISLVEKGFYDGTPFHRVLNGFMAQGGDPTGTGTGGPGYAIRCECGEPSARKHFLGTLSMAHAGKDTGGSQFFLTFRPTEHLDGRHTVFGRVIEGFEVLPELKRTDGEVADPGSPDSIKTATVLRKRDHDYNPETLSDPRQR